MQQVAKTLEKTLELETTELETSVQWYDRMKRDRIVRVLEGVQDLIVISLCIGLFCFMVIELREMFISLLPPLSFHEVTADILFLLILVELFRLLIIYLQEQRVSIGVAVEVSIVSVLREVIVRGLLETAPSQVLSACAFLLVMGVLLVIRAWLPPTFAGIDPEKRISRMARAMAEHPPWELTHSADHHTLTSETANTFIPFNSDSLRVNSYPISNGSVNERQ